MKKVTVKQKTAISIRFPFFLLRPIFYLWPLLFFALPVLVFYGLVNFGMPMIWLSENRHYCNYIDPIGYYSFPRYSGMECNWYAFRNIQLPQFQKLGDL